MNRTNELELAYAEATMEHDASPPDENHIELTSLDSVESKEPEWIIDGVIPKGEISEIVGPGGVGKSYYTCDIAAAVSAGQKSLFDIAYGTEEVNTEHRKVIMFSSEDSLSVQIRRRLEAAGADLKNILSIDLSDPRFSDIRFDSDFLADIVKQEQPALMIFDPFQSFIGKINIAARNEVRNALNPLIQLGAEYGTSFLIVIHTNKKMDAYGRNRMADSADLWDIARSVFITGFTTEAGIRYLSHEKSNYGPMMDTILYTIADGQVEFVGLTDNKDADYVRDFRRQKQHSADQLDHAKEKIMSALDDGAKAVKEVDSICLADGISPTTLRRAKTELNNNHMIREWSKGVADNHTWYMESVKQR